MQINNAVPALRRLRLPSGLSRVASTRSIRIMASKCAGVDGVDIKDALALRAEDISDDIIVVSLLDDFKSDDFDEFILGY